MSIYSDAMTRKDREHAERHEANGGQSFKVVAMEDSEIIARLTEQAKEQSLHGQNAAVLAKLFGSTTPEERKQRREAAVARWRSGWAS